MRRRDFITLVGASAVALSRTVNADPTRQVRRLGFLAATAESDPEFRPLDAAFWQRLQELGWREGSNLHLDRRWAAGDAGRAQINAAELVGLAPDLIFALGTPALVALRKNTRTIPIVFVGVSDPVGQGFVTNLARPGGNLTGFTHFEPTFGTKWLGLLKEIVADLVRVSVIFNPQTASHAGLFLRALESVAPAFAIDVSAAPIHDMPEVEATLKALVQRPGAGLVFPPDVFDGY
jgi:putative ABC transport system substrate-binding protein